MTLLQPVDGAFGVDIHADGLWRFADDDDVAGACGEVGVVDGERPAFWRSEFLWIVGKRRLRLGDADGLVTRFAALMGAA